MLNFREGDVQPQESELIYDIGVVVCPVIMYFMAGLAFYM